jgi:hypothetical protein
MCYKNQYKILIIFFISLILGGCIGIFQPIGMGNIEVPPGPPEFQAGWHNGCSSAFSAGGFAAGKFYKLSMGTGIYQHDPVYQSAWQSGWFACVTRAGGFSGFQGINTAPFQ